MFKNKSEQMTPEELEMANEILELERQKKEKELADMAKKKEKEIKRLEKEQAKINGIPYDDVSQKKVKEIAQETSREEEQFITDNQNNINTQDLKKDDVTFNNSLKSFLRGIDPKKKKRRYEVLIENLYGFAAGGSKEAIRAIITMVERIEGRPGINQSNGDEDKDNTLAQEIHALAEVVRNKDKSEDGGQGS